MKAFEPRRFGSYVLTAHLGRGGMADVFRAQRTGAAGFERTVVIKRILQPYNDDPAFVQMFVDEAKIAARLTHPNIAQVFELGEVDGEYFMALEYVKGKDLLHVLKHLARRETGSRALPPEAAAFVAREVCRGLGAAHDHTDENGAPQPIIHRDVSPQNIMVAYDGQVKLVDFGIAKAVLSAREQTRTGALKGKIAYMAPEQIEGTSPGPDSDVFSVGVVLYEMLIGRRLFKGDNDYETLKRVQSMPIPAPSRVEERVPERLDQVVLKALERTREQRYRRASQMARDLDDYLQQARFSVEDMAEWMGATFPPEAREEIPDGKAYPTPDPTRSPSRASGPAGSRGMTSPGTPKAIASRSGASSQGGRRTWLIAAGLALAVGAGGALVALGPLEHRPPPGEREITPEAEPAVRAVEAPAPPAPVVTPLPAPTTPSPLDAGVAHAPHPSTARAPAAHASHHAAEHAEHARDRKPPEPKPEPKIELFDDSPASTPTKPSRPPAPTGQPKIETFDD